MHTREFNTAELLATEQRNERMMTLYRELAMKAIAFVIAERVTVDKEQQLNAAYDAMILLDAQPRVSAIDKAHAARVHSSMLDAFTGAVEHEGERLDEVKEMARKLVSVLEGASS